MCFVYENFSRLYESQPARVAPSPQSPVPPSPDSNTATQAPLFVVVVAVVAGLKATSKRS